MKNYLSIITLNVNGLNAPIKRHRTAEWIRKHDPHICCLQETHLRKKRLTQTESEGLETNFPSKRTGKKSRGNNTHIRQNRLPKKGHRETQKVTSIMKVTQRKNPPRRHKHCKYICTQHRSTQIHNENLGGLQERY